MDLSWLPSFICFVMGILILGLTFKKSIENKDEPHHLHWKESIEKEHEMQFIRPKTIPEDLFLVVNFEQYPYVENPDCQKVYLKLLNCSKSPMVNLGQLTNLEIKQQFGSGGLENLINYEKNYFNFMDISYEYGSILYDNGFINESRKTLEMSISYGCDLSKTYLLLIQIYKTMNDFKALDRLKEAAVKNIKHSVLLKKVLNLLS